MPKKAFYLPWISRRNNILSNNNNILTEAAGEICNFIMLKKWQFLVIPVFMEIVVYVLDVREMISVTYKLKMIGFERLTLGKS